MIVVIITEFYGVSHGNITEIYVQSTGTIDYPVELNIFYFFNKINIVLVFTKMSMNLWFPTV